MQKGGCEHRASFADFEFSSNICIGDMMLPSQIKDDSNGQTVNVARRSDASFGSNPGHCGAHSLLPLTFGVCLDPQKSSS